MDEKEGRWIYQEDEYGQDGWRCDRCGYFVPWYYKYYKDPHFIADYRFCPKCGRAVKWMTDSEKVVIETPDKGAVIDGLDSLLSAYAFDSDEVQAIGGAIVLLRAQPEIIRCKDCKNWIPGSITYEDDFIPPKCGKYQQMVGHSADDYCSLGERMEGDPDDCIKS